MKKDFERKYTDYPSTRVSSIGNSIPGIYTQRRVRFACGVLIGKMNCTTGWEIGCRRFAPLQLQLNITNGCVRFIGRIRAAGTQSSANIAEISVSLVRRVINGKPRVKTSRANIRIIEFEFEFDIHDIPIVYLGIVGRKFAWCLKFSAERKANRRDRRK